MTLVRTTFSINYDSAAALKRAATEALKTALNVQPNERVLIMTNPDSNLPMIAQAVYNAALELNASPVLLIQSARSRLDLAEKATLGAIASEPDVMFTITRESLGNDPNGLRQPYCLGSLTFNHIFYYLIASGKSRGAWCPSADIDIFCRTVAIDYQEMWRRSKRLKKIFDMSDSIHVKTPAGSDLTITLNGREGMLDDGDYRNPGTGGNLPAGEVFTVPTRNSHGIAVIDGSAGLAGGTVRVSTPFRLNIEKGKIVSVEGSSEARAFQKTLETMRDITERQITEGVISEGQAEIYRSNVNSLAEFGIGLNPAATLSGNMTEDEKAFNTCHIAVGDDCYGIAPAVDHFDMIMLNPEIEFLLDDGRRIIVDPFDPPEIE